MRTHKEYSETITEADGFSFIKMMFKPTTDMAAELMNVPSSVVEEWLQQEHIPIVHGNKLTDRAIDFLATKYVHRLHKYFNNCLESWDTLDRKERDLFNQFKRQYGKTFHFWVREWKDLNQRLIIKDFKNELDKKAFKEFFPDLNCFEVDSYHDEVVPDVYFSDFYVSPTQKTENSILLSSISHSLLYGARIKTKLPTVPDYRDISLEIIQENRFHIFTEESDSNGQFDAFLFDVKQPQFAIALVLGYQGHKNHKTNGCYQKNQTYHCYKEE